MTPKLRWTGLVLGACALWVAVALPGWRAASAQATGVAKATFSFKTVPGEQAAAAKLHAAGFHLDSIIDDSWWVDHNQRPTQPRRVLTNHVTRVEMYAPRYVLRGQTRQTVDDTTLTNLLPLTELRSLLLWQTKITDIGLERMTGLTKLRGLGLSEAKITDRGLVHLAGLTELRALNLSGTGVADAGLIHMAGMTNLETLWCFTTKLTGSGFCTFEKFVQIAKTRSWRNANE